MGVKAVRLHVFPLASIASLLIVTLDRIRAHRSNFWTGDDLVQMAAPVVPFVVYTLIVYVLSRMLVWMWTRRFALSFAVSAACVWLATLVLAGVLSGLSSDFSSKLVIALLGGVAAVFALVAILGRVGVLPEHLGTLVAFLSILVSWPTMHITGHTFYIHASRHTLVTALPVAWALLVGLILGFALWYWRRRSVRVAMGFFLIFSVAPFSLLWFPRGAESVDPEQPSLFFVTFDALRADYCSVYGGKALTPNFERIADEGVVFEQAYALAPWTLASVNSLYSSTYPYGLTPGAPWDQWRREVSAYEIDSTQETLAQRLQAKGYATALITGNALLGQRPPIRRGFETVFRLGPDVNGLTGPWAYVPSFLDVLERIAPAIADSRPVDTTAVLSAYAMEYIRSHRGEPIFMWLHFLDPHDPYDPPTRFRNRSGPWELFRPRDFQLDTPEHRIDGTLYLEDDETSFVKSLYEAEIEYVDEAFGEVYDTILDTGHGADSVVVLSADHGEEFWDHGKWGHGHSLHNEVIHVPLIVKAPQFQRGRVAEPFSHIDLIPTLAELMGAGQDAVWQGHSRVANIAGSGGPITAAVFARATHLVHPEEPLEMTVSNAFKLIVGLESSTTLLYHLRDDPGERVNVADEQSAALESLQAGLTAWRLSFPSTYEELNALRAAPINEEVLEIMDSLGYLQ